MFSSKATLQRAATLTNISFRCTIYTQFISQETFPRRICIVVGCNILLLFSSHSYSLGAQRCEAAGNRRRHCTFSETKATQVCFVHQMKMSLFFFDSLISQADLSGHFHGSGSSLLLYAVRDGRENKCSKCLWLH